MDNIPITIAIVSHNKTSDSFFMQSIYSALSQIGVKFKINIYHDNRLILEKRLINNINIIKISKNIINRPAKVREYIVDDVDTPYLAFWDSDDIYAVNRLNAQHLKISDNDLDLCFSNFKFFNDNKIFKNDFFSLIGFRKREIDIFDENYIGLGMIMAKVSFLRALKSFPDVKTLDWWIAIKSYLLNAKVGFCSDVHGYYRIHDKSLSKLVNNVDKNDFINERNNKINLFKNLLNEVPELSKRFAFYKSLDVEKDYEFLRSDFEKKKYKNIWGGLIKYVEK